MINSFISLPYCPDPGRAKTCGSVRIRIRNPGRSFPRLSRHDLAYQALKVGINTCPANDAEQIRKELNALKVSR